MTAALIRAYLRRGRWGLLVWVLALGLLPGLMAVSTRIGYPTQADLSQFARESMANLSEVALRGPIFAETTGALVAWTLASSGSLVGAVAALVLVVRYARGDEQAGRIELMLAGRLTRAQQLRAALGVVGLAGVGVGAVAAVGLLAVGMPAPGSALLGAVLCCSILFFVGVGAVVSQVATSPRAAGMLGGAVLTVSLVVAAVGDVTGTPVVWLSPFGWARHAQAFVADRWWAPLIALAAAGLLAWWAAALNRGRDYGAGLIAARPGRAHAASWIRGPLSLAVRLNRAPALAWGAVMAFLGALIGSVVPTLDAQLAGTAFADFAARRGGAVGEVFFAFVVYVLAQVGTAAALAVLLGLRADETGGLAEPVLARGVGRIRWAASGLVAAFLTGMVASLALVVGAGVSGRWSLAASALAYLPTVLVVLGLGMALLGWAPRAAVAASWAVLGLLLFTDLLSEFGLLPADVVARASPFAATFTALFTGDLPGVMIALTLTGVALATLGLVGLVRRDLG